MPSLPSSDFLMLQLRLKGIWQRKSLGQHFLFDDGILARIADATGADATSVAVEIGPGPGSLTAQLAARARVVAAVELDRRLEPLHADVFGPHPQVHFQYADALRTDLPALAREQMAATGATSAVLTGNLPFQITSPLLFAQCGPDVPWRRIAVMVQKEVADRIAARPACKAYGILTVKLAAWWRFVERFEVPAEMFVPPPRVHGSVIVLEPDASLLPPDVVTWWPGFSEFVDAAFAQRRKKMLNSLAGRWPAFPGREAGEAVLIAAGVDIGARAEELTLAQFIQVFDGMRGKGNHGLSADGAVER